MRRYPCKFCQFMTPREKEPVPGVLAQVPDFQELPGGLICLKNRQTCAAAYSHWHSGTGLPQCNVPVLYPVPRISAQVGTGRTGYEKRYFAKFCDLSPT